MNLTFISLLDVKEFGGSSVLGAFVALLVRMENDGQGSVAFPYLTLGGGIGQVEHRTVTKVSHEDDGDGVGLTRDSLVCLWRPCLVLGTLQH